MINFEDLNVEPKYGMSTSMWTGFYMTDIDVNGDWIEIIYSHQTSDEHLATKPRKHKLYHNTKGSYFNKYGQRYYTDEFYRLS